MTIFGRRGEVIEHCPVEAGPQQTYEAWLPVFR